MIRYLNVIGISITVALVGIVSVAYISVGNDKPRYFYKDGGECAKVEYRNGLEAWQVDNRWGTPAVFADKDSAIQFAKRTCGIQ